MVIDAGHDLDLPQLPGRGVDQLDPADEWAISTDEALLTIAMPAAAALALADALRPTVGTYETEEAPGLVVDVEETILRDSTGAEIGRVG